MAISTAANRSAPAASSSTPLLSPTSSTSNTHSASRSTYSSLPAYSARAAYQQLVDEVFVQSFQIDEDLSFSAEGRVATPFRGFLYLLLCFFTGGIFYLICRWNIWLEMLVRTHRCSLANASHLFVRNHWDELSLDPIQSLDFDGTLADAFPQLFDTSTHGIIPPNNFWMHHLKVFEYRYYRFVLEPISGRFVPNYIFFDPKWQSLSSILVHRDSDEAIDRKRLIFGTNVVDIQEKSTLRLLIDEVLHPFFVFQIASIILWSLDSYYYYASCILVISVASAISTLIETKSTLARIRDLSRFSCQIRYWRNGAWTYGQSDELIPGDLFELEAGPVPIVPCDAVLLEGDCIVNESMLTGESLPVSKISASDQDLASLDFEEEEPASSSRISRFFLFSGTELIRVRPGHSPMYQEDRQSNSSIDVLANGADEPGTTSQGRNSGGSASSQTFPIDPMLSRRSAIALVVRTGFNTTKGNLVRSILFPRPNKFKFYQDSFRFICILAAISALGFSATLYNFIRLQVSWQTIVKRALDLITIAVPPALPATLAIGTSFAINRMRKSNIFCTSPPRVNICGKINLMCFDKTGTLTQEGLDVLGIRFTVPQTNKSDTPVEKISAATPLRFSRLYRTIDSLAPRPIPAQIRAEFTQARPHSLTSSLGSAMQYQTNSYSEQHMHLGNGFGASPFSAISGVSVFLATESAGHPNSETDFPYPLIVCAMATCHSIKLVHGELIGDPLDLKMFEYTGWHLEEEAAGSNWFVTAMAGNGGAAAATNAPGIAQRRRSIRQAESIVVRPPGSPGIDAILTSPRHSNAKVNPDEVFTELSVVRTFEFMSSLRRMSVVVRRVKYSRSMLLHTGGYDIGSGQPPGSMGSMLEFEVFVKGAPEVMRGICTPESCKYIISSAQQ
eukprot:jgi/Hompol1/5572/HPOL_000424-RA